MSVYSEDQQAKKMLQDMRWDKELPCYWNNSQNRILGPARTETPAGPEEIGPQLPPREGTAGPWAGSDDGPTLTVSQKPSSTAPCSLTNEKSRRRWIILVLLSYRPIQDIYSTLNVKTYLFSLLAHKLFPLSSCPIPHKNWNFRKFFMSTWISHSAAWKSTKIEHIPHSDMAPGES